MSLEDLEIQETTSDESEIRSPSTQEQQLAHMEEYFKGNREAFKGTAIYNDPEVTWEKWPVITLDMNKVGGTTFEEVKLSLVKLVRIL